MTELSQRIAIAEECGWTQIVDQSEPLMMPPGYSVVGYPPESQIVGHKREIPDYLHDLNAMHLAELVCLNSGNNRLNPDEGEESDWDHYIWELERIVGRGCAEEEIYAFTINSTAAQRAEALLRTKNRWIDEKPFDSGKSPS